MLDLEIELKKYKHKFEGIVRFSDVDAFGVVHNAKYFIWMEAARTEYYKTLGMVKNPAAFLREYPVMVVHNEIDYFIPAFFNDEYSIYTRISYIKSSSFCFENIVVRNNEILAKAASVFVFLNAREKRPEKIPDNFRSIFIEFESENMVIYESDK
ncbi:MAG: thioesterase family protein [Candidatus Kapabacteria bacterium]|nr:thioesterase family protein [Candidatus Kapabacteria bacterium]